MRDALIVDAVRSPIGRRNGTLASVRADELAGQVLNGLVERNALDPAEVEDVQMGCVSQVGEQGWNIGRMAPLVAGWPDSVPGTTIDRQCGSSMQANFNAAAAVWSGQLDLVVSAGVESMSRVPMGSSGGDLSDKLLERWEIVPQGISAELIAVGVGALARGARRVLVRVAPAGAGGDRGGPVRAGDRAGGGVEPARRDAVRRRRDAARGHVSRGARGAGAGVPAGREGDRGELEPDLRRRGRRSDRERGCLLPAGARAAGAVRVVRARRRRSAADAARQPAGVFPRAGAGRARVGRRRRDRGERGVRVGRAAVPAGRRAGRAGRGREPERGRDLARASARRHGRADHGDAAGRARAAAGPLRPRDDVHRLRPGDRRP